MCEMRVFMCLSVYVKCMVQKWPNGIFSSILRGLPGLCGEKSLRTLCKTGIAGYFCAPFNKNRHGSNTIKEKKPQRQVKISG